jgi:hypothetical protein
MPASLSGIGLKACLLVWRVENFELAAVDEAHHGQFYSGDSYVLLRTTASGSSAANELFIWQGEDSSQDERGASAIQSVRVAEAVAAAGGAHCSQSRETQGNESDAFKAVFKGAAGAGLIYLQGGVKSGFHHVEGADAAHEPSLLHVKGRRSVVTRQVAVAAKSLNQGDCFILDLFSTLFLWAGAKANTVEKAKAVEVMARLSNSRGAHCERVVLATADAARAGQFWAALGGSEADVQPARDDDDAPSADAQPPKLFALAAGGAATPVAEGRLTRAALLAAAAGGASVLLVDGGADVYAWVAHAAPNAERHRALELADKYVAAARAGAAPRVSVVHQGGETPQFQGLFAEWDAPPTFDFAAKASQGVAHGGAAAVPIDYDSLLATAAAAVAAVETISLKSWAVSGTSVSEVPAAAAGEFFAGDCVVVEHTSRVAGTKGPGSTVAYFWLGKASTHVEQGHAALTAVEITDRAKQEGRTAHQMRVVQGSEPPAFATAFGGMLVIHQGERSATAAAAAAPRLFHIKGVSPANVRAVQVAAKATSLNSGDAFVLLSGKGDEWCWLGTGCSAEERAAALKLAARLASAGKVAEVAEGAEPAGFWELLGGKAAYAKSVPALPEGRAARLFEVSDQGGSGLRVDEVLSFSQADLLPDSVCVLDVASVVFVWIGKEASALERSGAMGVANKYVAAAAKAGRLDANVPIAVVEAGAEPAEFTANFAGWDASAVAASGEDVYAKRLAQLAAQKAADAGKFEAAAAAREARNAAAIAHLAEKRVAIASSAADAAPASWTRPLKHVEKKA